MITRPETSDNIFLLIVYALAALSGGLGGCVVWSYYTKTHTRITAFVLAYAIMGLVFGLVAAAVMSIFVREVSIHELLLYSLFAGFGGTAAIFGVNWGAGVAFRWKHFEVKFTVRKPTQDRRKED